MRPLPVLVDSHSDFTLQISREGNHDDQQVFIEHVQRVLYGITLLAIAFVSPALAQKKPNILIIWGDDIG